MVRVPQICLGNMAVLPKSVKISSSGADTKDAPRVSAAESKP